MHGRFMLTPANVLFLELRYEILKFFMHASFLYNLEDILQEKSANYMLSWKIHTSSANRWFSSEWYSCTGLKIKYFFISSCVEHFDPESRGKQEPAISLSISLALRFFLIRETYIIQNTSFSHNIYLMLRFDLPVYRYFCLFFFIIYNSLVRSDSRTSLVERHLVFIYYQIVWSAKVEWRFW